MKFGVFTCLLVTLTFVCAFPGDEAYTTATSANFDSLVLKDGDAVGVLFCEPEDPYCIQTKMDLDMVVAWYARGGQTPRPIELVYVDMKASPEIAQKYNVTSIPTFIGFHNSKIITTYTGTLYNDDTTRAIIVKMMTS